MRYIRRSPVRYRRRENRIVSRRRLLLLAGVLAGIWLVISETGLATLSEELTCEAARGYLLSSISRAVAEELEEWEGSFVAVSRTPDGRVSSVSADAAGLNSFRAGVLERLKKALNGTAAVFVPLGSLTGVGVFNGRGPKVPVKLNFEGSAAVDFHTEFISAGINQSCHRITMTVTARAYSQSRRFETRAEEALSTVIAETVVVGQVPEVALTG